MNSKKIINVAVIARFEENEKDFINLITNNEFGNINYKEHNINFLYEKIENIKLKIKKLVSVTDKIILLVNSIDGVTPKMSDIIDELVNNNIIPIIILNHISNPKSSPSRTVEEIDHVLVSANASDEQLEYPIVYLDDENRIATLDLNEAQKDFSILYDLIVNND